MKYDLFCKIDGIKGSFESAGGRGSAGGSDRPGPASIGEAVREPAAELTGFGGGAGGTFGP